MKRKLPVTAVIYTHGHADHYLGAGGVIDPAEAAKRGVPILAPEGFLEGLFTESVLAGNAMGRRFQFQSGQGIPIGPAGTVDFGQGKVPGSRGKGGMIAATLFIKRRIPARCWMGRNSFSNAPREPNRRAR